MKNLFLFTLAFCFSLSVFSQKTAVKENLVPSVNGKVYPTNADVAKSEARSFKLLEVKNTTAAGSPKQKVVKFVIATRTVDAGGTTFSDKSVTVTGGKFNAKAIALVSKVKIGVKIYIKDISVVNAAGKTVKVSGINFTVR